MAIRTIEHTLKLGERTIELDEEIRIEGLYGKWRFRAYVTETAGTERVDVIGPHYSERAAQFRSFPIDRIRPLPKKRGQ